MNAEMASKYTAYLEVQKKAEKIKKAIEELYGEDSIKTRMHARRDGIIDAFDHQILTHYIPIRK